MCADRLCYSCMVAAKFEAAQEEQSSYTAARLSSLGRESLRRSRQPPIPCIPYLDEDRMWIPGSSGIVSFDLGPTFHNCRSIRGTTRKHSQN